MEKKLPVADERIQKVPANPRKWIGMRLRAGVAQLVEHVLGKDGVTGSIPVSSLYVFSSLKDY